MTFFARRSFFEFCSGGGGGGGIFFTAPTIGSSMARLGRLKCLVAGFCILLFCYVTFEAVDAVLEGLAGFTKIYGRRAGFTRDCINDVGRRASVLARDKKNTLSFRKQGNKQYKETTNQSRVLVVVTRFVSRAGFFGSGSGLKLAKISGLKLAKISGLIRA